ncbi:MAG: flagellar basal body P-ring formation chaperone FlgA [Pseudomonadota bacterium]
MRLSTILGVVALAGLCAPAQSEAGGLVSTRMLTSGTVIAPSDVRRSEGSFAGAIQDPSKAVGLETRRTIYAGRPLTAADLGPPAEIRRNDNVALRFLSGALRITTEGRALGRGARGDRISVMNLDSRVIVFGRVAGPGVVEVGR